MVLSKQQTVLGHNFIILNDKKYIFHEINLIILRESNNKPNISLLKLFSDNFKHTKLTKYHFSNNHAIFFFIYRNYEKRGVHFYLIISIQDLLLLI